jgi:hypothetical protein
MERCLPHGWLCDLADPLDAMPSTLRQSGGIHLPEIGQRCYGISSSTWTGPMTIASNDEIRMPWEIAP